MSPFLPCCCYLTVFILLLFSNIQPSCSKHLPSLTTPLSSSITSEDPSLLLTSLTDGRIIAFDSRTGKEQWQVQIPKLPMTSESAPGHPIYLPGMDGALYRIKPSGDAIQRLKNTFQTPQGPAHVLSRQEKSAMYIDARTGNLMRTLTHDDPPQNNEALWVPTSFDRPLVVLSRTDMSIVVRDVATSTSIAKVSLAYTTPSLLRNGRFSNDHQPSCTEQPSLRAFVSDGNLLTVRDGKSGKVLWSRMLPDFVHEMHAVGKTRVGVKVSSSQALPGLFEGNSDSSKVLVVKRHGQLFALPSAQVVSPTMKGATRAYALDDRTSSGPVDFPLALYQKSRGSTVNDDSLVYRDLEEDEEEEEDDPYDYYRENDEEDVKAMDSHSGARKNPRRILELSVAFLLGGLVLVIFYRQLAPSATHSKKHKKAKAKKRRRAKAGAAGGEKADQNDQDVGANGEQHVARDYEDIQFQSPPHNLDYFSSPPSNHSTTSNGSSYSRSVRSADGWTSVGRLRISPRILGNGSHGTVVFEGILTPGDRRVAVKRLLRHLFDSARQEISLLIELDEASPHVVRYFAMEEDETFIYLALELCAGSLGERVISCNPPALTQTHKRGAIPTTTHMCLRNLIQGLDDLHSAGVVHRDLKPQNVLLARSSLGSDVKLADVGLALRLAKDRSSYTAVMNVDGCIGTRGWCAAEVIAGKRQTRKVDIFSAGCVLHFVLTKGKHPFGDTAFERDANIAAGKADLSHLRYMELPEAEAIIRRMISIVPRERPSAKEVLRHPFFWSDAEKLSFLCDVSDRLYDLRFTAAFYTRQLDSFGPAVQHLSDWPIKLDTCLLMTLNRGYNTSPSELLRVIRNKRSHYSELDAEVRRVLGRLPDDHSMGVDDGQNFLTYFTNKFPHLLICVYEFSSMNPELVSQHHFRRYGFVSSEPTEQLYGASDGDYSDYSPSASVSSIDRRSSRFVYTEGFLKESQTRQDPQCHSDIKSSLVYDPSVKARWTEILSHPWEVTEEIESSPVKVLRAIGELESIKSDPKEELTSSGQRRGEKFSWTSRVWRPDGPPEKFGSGRTSLSKSKLSNISQYSGTSQWPKWRSRKPLDPNRDLTDFRNR